MSTAAGRQLRSSLATAAARSSSSSFHSLRFIMPSATTRTTTRPTTSFRSFSCSSYAAASATTPASSTSDPQAAAAQVALANGTQALQSGDLPRAAEHYRASLAIKHSAVAWYNLGVVLYQSGDLPGAIDAFKESLLLVPEENRKDGEEIEPVYPPTTEMIVRADTHTNLGAAYILSEPPRPDLALSHLQQALELTPDDGEVCYNIAAVLESTGEIEEALVAYGRARILGIERAAVGERNISAKLIGLRREEEEAKLQAAAAIDVDADSPSDAEAGRKGSLSKEYVVDSPVSGKTSI